MADNITVFLHDGVVEGVFASSPETNICIIDFDRDTGDRDYENERWSDCKKTGMHLIIPEFDHCEPQS